jgi:hypothetical protein
MTTSALSNPLPARLEAPLVRVGVAAVDVEAVAGETVEVGVPEVLEALTVLVVSRAEEEDVVIGGTVLETLVGPLELELERIELEEMEVEEVEVERMGLREPVLDEIPLREAGVEDTTMDRVVLGGIVLDAGLVEDDMIEETVLGGTVLEGLILVETALVLALVAAEAARVVLDACAAPHFCTKLWGWT